jgi:diaminopimelate decarboxylase
MERMTEDHNEWMDVLTLAANRFSTPFYLLRLPVYTRRVARLENEVTAQLNECRLKQWYSYKTLPVPHFALGANKECQLGVEVTSEFELKAVLAAGIASKDILVNGPCKHLWLPRDVPNLTVAFDSAFEVQELAQVSRALNWNVGLRLSLSNQRDPDDETYPAQFGIIEEDISQAVTMLNASGNPATFVHFHLRSNISLKMLEAAASEAARIVSSCGNALSVRAIDFGGGLPEPNVLSSGRELANEVTFSLYAQSIARCRKFFPTSEEVWIENGRALVGPAGALVVSVGDVKNIEGNRILLCDGGRTNNALESDWGIHTVNPLGIESSITVPTIVCGPSCMPYDWIYRGNLSSAIERGTKIAYFNAGAYHIPWETRFSRGLCTVILQDMTGALICIRQKESAEDWLNSWAQPERSKCD